MSSLFNFNNMQKKFIVIGGPCVAENLEQLFEVAESFNNLSKELDFIYIFKTSFDKANRTSITSYRGEGLQQTLIWLETLKNKFKIPILTDVHESYQVKEVAHVCDVIQIPAFLCRQTDLIINAVQSGKAVNIKKGQFISPHSIINIINKAKHAAEDKHLNLNIAITERGNCFGYDSLIVDMKNFQIISEYNVPVLFDCTHSVQKPPSLNNNILMSMGERKFIPALTRAAIATGYLSGLFLEIHPNPNQAKSDKFSQLSINTATILLKQILPLWQQSYTFKKSDKQFDF